MTVDELREAAGIPLRMGLAFLFDKDEWAMEVEEFKKNEFDALRIRKIESWEKTLKEKED